MSESSWISSFAVLVKENESRNVNETYKRTAVAEHYKTINKVIKLLPPGAVSPGETNKCSGEKNNG